MRSMEIWSGWKQSKGEHWFGSTNQVFSEICRNTEKTVNFFSLTGNEEQGANTNLNRISGQRSKETKRWSIKSCSTINGQTGASEWRSKWIGSNSKGPEGTLHTEVENIAGKNPGIC